MAKPGRRPGRESRAGAVTRKRIVTAALKTLKRDGFGGASARVVARNGRFNPALIFYHFGSVQDVLLAALDETSRVRMARYREALEKAGSLSEVLGVATDLYREDLSSGHITVLAEMIAGASSVPDLGPEIVSRIKPWIEMTEEVLARTFSGTPLAQIVPPAKVAFGVVALYLGIELLTHLQGDQKPAEELFKLAIGLTPAITSLLGTPEG